MDTKKLASVLRKEKEELKVLLNAARLKQKALIENNRPGIEDCTVNEEKAIYNIQEIEKERLKLMHEAFQSAGIESRETKLSSLVELLGDKLAQDEIDLIKSGEAEMKKYIGEITSVNRQNMFLIKQSRQFVQETINAIISKSERSILDKKV